MIGNSYNQVQSETTNDTEIKIKKTKNKPSIEKADEKVIREKAQDRKLKSKVGDSSSGNHSEDDSEAKQKPKLVRKMKLKPPPGKVKAISNGIGNEKRDPGMKIVPEYEKIEKKDVSQSRNFSLEEVSTSEKKKGHGRAFSSPDNDHALLKLLDYDDFVARLSALKKD